MPLIAVAGMYMGASALAAGAVGWGAFAAIGGIVGGVGALTGNKELASLGAIAGLAGGVGSWMTSTGAVSPFAGAEAGASVESNTEAMIKDYGTGVDSPTKGLTAGADELSNTMVNSVEFNAPTDGTAGLPDNSIGSNITSPVNGGNGALFNADMYDAEFGYRGESPASQAMSGADVVNNKPPTDAPRSMGGRLGPEYDNLRKDSPRVPGVDLPNKPGGKFGVLDVFKGFGKWAEDNKMLAAIGANFIGGMFDDEKKAKTALYKTRAEAEKKQMENASAIPNMNFSTKSTGPTFPSTSPTYNPVRPAGLFTAR